MRLIQKLFAGRRVVTGFAVMAQTPIKVGIANDLSGPFAALGAEARDGFNLRDQAVGWQTRWYNRLSFCRQTWAATLIKPVNWSIVTYSVTKLISLPDRLDRTWRLAVGPALFAAKIPYLSNNPGPSQFAGAQCNDYWFGVSYQNDAFHEAAGKVAADRGFKNMVIMAPDYPAGKDALNGFKRGYKTSCEPRGLHQAWANRLCG
jgi:branched-chain amino acid transport system substrate-binding protein